MLLYMYASSNKFVQWCFGFWWKFTYIDKCVLYSIQDICSEMSIFCYGNPMDDWLHYNNHRGDTDWVCIHDLQCKNKKTFKKTNEARLQWLSLSLVLYFSIYYEPGGGGGGSYFPYILLNEIQTMFSQLAKRSARFLPADLCTDHAHYVKP